MQQDTVRESEIFSLMGQNNPMTINEIQEQVSKYYESISLEGLTTVLKSMVKNERVTKINDLYVVNLSL